MWLSWFSSHDGLCECIVYMCVVSLWCWFVLFLICSAGRHDCSDALNHQSVPSTIKTWPIGKVKQFLSFNTIHSQMHQKGYLSPTVIIVLYAPTAYKTDLNLHLNLNISGLSLSCTTLSSGYHLWELKVKVLTHLQLFMKQCFNNTYGKWKKRKRVTFKISFTRTISNIVQITLTVNILR